MKATVFVVALLLAAPCGASAQTSAEEMVRGERVGWARLKTPSLYWLRHSGGDSALMQYIRVNTSLNISPTWHVADVNDLKQMCEFPLVFSQGIDMVNTPSARANLAEYIRRGGFLLIDACINNHVTPDPDVFLQRQTGLLGEIIPEARVALLPPEHEIYTCFFTIPDGKPPHTFNDNIYDARWAKHGLYAISIGPRMAGLISLSGLQCGWDHTVALHPPGQDIACMRMMVNIYIYAMLQHG